MENIYNWLKNPNFLTITLIQLLYLLGQYLPTKLQLPAICVITAINIIIFIMILMLMYEKKDNPEQLRNFYLKWSSSLGSSLLTYAILYFFQDSISFIEIDFDKLLQLGALYGFLILGAWYAEKRITL